MGFFTRCWKNAERAAAVGLCLLLAGCKLAPAESRPSIEVLAFSPVAANAQLTLSHQLSPEVLDALRHGVSVTFQWRLEQRQNRPVLWDSLLWSRSGERQISYRSLSQYFTLLEPVSGEATSFRDLPALLAALDQVPLEAVPTDAEGAYFQVRARLVISRLPPALRLSSYLSDQWRMDTGWVRLTGVTS
ncbi:MAG: DUF4390 domain-containing protein [Pseudomonadota bacterium]